MNAVNVNPHAVRFWIQKFTDRARGEKFYRVGFEYLSYAQFSRRKLKRATQAMNYGERVVERWKRLYTGRSANDKKFAKP